MSTLCSIYMHLAYGVQSGIIRIELDLIDLSFLIVIILYIMKEKKYTRSAW